MNIYQRYYNTKEALFNNGYGTKDEKREFELAYAALNYCLASVQDSLNRRQFGDGFDVDPVVKALVVRHPNMLKLVSDLQNYPDRPKDKEKDFTIAVFKAVYLKEQVKKAAEEAKTANQNAPEERA